MNAGAFAGAGVFGQPLGHLAGPQHLRGHLEALVGLGFDRGQRHVQPLPQRPELKGVEKLVDGLTVPRMQPEVIGADV